MDTATHEHVKLTAADVHAYASRDGILIVTIPDAIAERLFALVDDAAGGPITDSWARCASTTLIALANAAPIPAGLSDHWHRLAVVDRDGLIGGRRITALIAGATAYDPEAGTWLRPRSHYGHLRTWSIPTVSGDTVVWREWDR